MAVLALFGRAIYYKLELASRIFPLLGPWPGLAAGCWLLAILFNPALRFRLEADIYQGHFRPLEINSSVQLHLQFNPIPPVRTSSVSSVLTSLCATHGWKAAVCTLSPYLPTGYSTYKLSSVGHRLTSKTDIFKSHIQSLRDPVDLREECLQPCSTSAKLALSTFLPVSSHKRPRTILSLCR